MLCEIHRGTFVVSGIEKKLHGLQSATMAFANQVSLAVRGIATSLNGAGIPTEGTLELVQNWGTDGTISGADLGSLTF